jgi:hypothetical protein
VSNDLLIYAKRQPKAADFDAFVGARDGFSADGRFKRDGYVLLSHAGGVAAEIDGPNRIEADDVADAANGAIGASGWLVQVSVKPSAEATWPMELATHLARSADGVVYDPQEDLVAWPAGFQPRDADTGEERTTEIELGWFTARPSTDGDLPRNFLRVLSHLAPEATPTRYGGYEPLPFRFEGPNAEEDFVDRWIKEASVGRPMIFWNATRPSFGGSAFMPRPDDEPYASGARDVTGITIRFDGRALARDPQVTERIVELFASMARGLDCVFACGSVHRDLVIRRGRDNADYRTEAGPAPFLDRWVGLPAAPSWLAWFGAPYAELVRDAVRDRITQETDGALFLRLGREPMNADELAEIFPPLPLALIARRTNKPAAWEAGVRFTFAGGPPSQPAEVIPEIAR